MSAWSQLDIFLGVALEGVWSAVWSQRRLRFAAAVEAADPLTAFRSPDLAFSASCRRISLYIQKNIRMSGKNDSMVHQSTELFQRLRAEISLWNTKEQQGDLTSSLDRFCSNMTSTYDLTCSLGSGVLPPARKSTNKNRGHSLAYTLGTRVDINTKHKHCQLNLTLFTNRLIYHVPVVSLNSWFTKQWPTELHSNIHLSLLHWHNILRKNKQIHRQKSWGCGAFFKWIKKYSHHWCRGPGLRSSEYVHFQCQGSICSQTSTGRKEA